MFPPIELKMDDDTVVEIRELEDDLKQTEERLREIERLRSAYEEARIPADAYELNLAEQERRASEWKERRERTLKRIAQHRSHYSYYLKAMNCPHHHKLFAAVPRSYRDLPLRLAERDVLSVGRRRAFRLMRCARCR
jgi:threonyl-tRNA synthetase